MYLKLATMAREIVIPLRVNVRERDKVDKEASRLGVTRAEVLRRLIDSLPDPDTQEG
jgi:hypothetical protein